MFKLNSPVVITAYTTTTNMAWTGGDSPKQLSVISREERQHVHELFRWHMLIHANHWGAVDTDRTRTFWRWARYDAHATFRPASFL